MTEKEVIEQIESIINDFNIGSDFDLRVNATDVKVLQTVLQLLEQKDKKIDELEKALVEEDLKHREWRNSMSEEEKKAIEYIENEIKNNRNKIIEIEHKNDSLLVGYGTMHDIYKLQNWYYSIILNLIEKQQTKIKELEADLYSANCTINDYIEERNKLKDKMIGDKMEQFDDYIVYLIESYLEIMGE